MSRALTGSYRNRSGIGKHAESGIPLMAVRMVPQEVSSCRIFGLGSH
ncbi:MAG: hypothetical protein ACYDEJ_15310 [Desulfitobacteriaceae bacterium]